MGNPVVFFQWLKEINIYIVLFSYIVSQLKQKLKKFICYNAKLVFRHK